MTMRTHLTALFAAFVLVIGIRAHAQTPGKLSPALQSALRDAGQADRLPTWVFFTDKGDDLSDVLREVEDSLTPHARARRARNRGLDNLVDTYDVPVVRRYVEEVRRRGAHIRHTSRWLNAVSIEMDARAVDAITALPFVNRMDLVRVGTEPLPDPVDATSGSAMQPAPSAFLLDYGSSLTQNNQINVPPLHDAGYSGNGVWICMMDTGFNNLLHVAMQNIDILITHDFVNGDSIVSDEVGQMGDDNHGTQTLSTIAGYAPGELIGPAYGATYILAKTENTTWERHIEEDAWVAAAEWADSIGADIISSSLGYSDGFTHLEPNYSWSELDGNTTIVVIGADIAASRGILVVNSAGNDGLVDEPANTLISPADGDSVLAVGAITSTGDRAGFSSVGPTADGRIKPDVMAMGQGVRAVSPFNTTGYVNVNGTSFSCPLTAGAAALILEAKPAATNAQIMDALRQTASQAGSPDRLMGWGIVDAATAAAVISTGIGDPPTPVRIVLHPAYPNPFNPTTTIRYELETTAHVNLTIFDVRGAVVATLVDATESPGPKSVVWTARNQDGGRLASGVYVYRLRAADAQKSRKVVLLK
jgi:subtilisin family serine protease